MALACTSPSVGSCAIPLGNVETLTPRRRSCDSEASAQRRQSVGSAAVLTSQANCSFEPRFFRRRSYASVVVDRSAIRVS
jgi:hypothetical protein